MASSHRFRDLEFRPEIWSQIRDLHQKKPTHLISVKSIRCVYYTLNNITNIVSSFPRPSLWRPKSSHFFGWKTTKFNRALKNFKRSWSFFLPMLSRWSHQTTRIPKFEIQTSKVIQWTPRLNAKCVSSLLICRFYSVPGYNLGSEQTDGNYSGLLVGSKRISIQT